MKACFKGVWFNVENCSITTEFRHTTHQYLQNDTSETEIIGKEAYTYPLSGFVFSSLSRDLLIKSCSSKKPGDLIHPILGIIRCYCVDLQVTESTEEKGISRIQIKFKGAPKKESLLTKIKDTEYGATSCFVEFVESFSVVNTPAIILQDIEESLSALSNFMTSRNGIGLIAHTTLDSTESLKNIKENIKRLLESPKKLGSNIKRAIDNLNSDEKEELEHEVLNLLKSEIPQKKLIGSLISILVADKKSENKRKVFLKKIRPHLPDPFFKASYYLRPAKKEEKKEILCFKPKLVADYHNKKDTQPENIFEAPVYV